jgi:hypothetical protein
MISLIIKQALIILIGAQLSFAAGGSRVGNGSGDGKGKSSSQIRSEKLGIEADLPNQFHQDFATDNTIQLKGPFAQRKNILKAPEQEQIRIWSLKNRLPEVTGLQDKDFNKWFSDRDWKKLSKPDAAPIVQFGQTQSLTTAVVAWKNDQGVVISTNNSEEGRRALKQLLETIKPLKDVGSEH